MIITDYGFNLSAARKISIFREDKERVSGIFSSVIFIKFSFMLISFLVLVGLVLAIPKFSSERIVYFFAFGVVVGNVLSPVWFFQGMERMKYITILNLLARIIFTVLIFLIIKKQADYLYVPLIGSLGYIVAGFLSLLIVFKLFKITIRIPSLTSVIVELRDGWHIFISTVAISLYTVSNTFVLGLFTNNIIVGYYNAADKLIKAVQGLFSPVSQTIYPYISKLAVESKERALHFIRMTTIFVGGVALFVSLVIFIFADPIVRIMLGEQYQESIIILKILAFLPFVIFITNMFGAQLLLPFNIKYLFTLSVIIPSVLHITLLIFIAPMYKAIGVAMLVVFTELAIVIYRMGGLYLFHKDIFIGVCYGKR